MKLDTFRHIQLITSGAQILLFVVGAQLESRLGWIVCLTIMAAISQYAWLSALQKYRAITSTPTSKIASAAQGYVELMGRGLPASVELTIFGKLTHLPCLWYRYNIEHKDHDGDWHSIESGTSENTFVLRDDTGDCVIDPDHADILTQHKQQWTSGFHRYTEWQLLKNDALYVLGEFRTQGGSTAEFDLHAEHNALLAEWKKNMPDLHARFDLNGDGQLDEQEWMLARRAAKREVAKKQTEVHNQSDVHILSQPRDDKLFVISNLSPEKIARHYLYWVWGNLLLFFGGLIGLGWVLQHAHF